MKTIIWNQAHTIALVFDITSKDVTQYTIMMESGVTISLAQMEKEILQLQKRMQDLFRFL